MANSTLCSKAWTDLNIRFGAKELRHCCKATSENFPEKVSLDFFNASKMILERRQDLLNGIENSQCASCWKSYRETGTSYREHRNQWKTQQEVSDQVKYIEVMFDNLCDMSCIYCSEHSSHKIAQEKGLSTKLQTPDQNLYRIFLDWLATLDYEYNLSFLGGELTYSKNFYNFLNEFVNDTRFNNKKIILSLMTNGNTSPQQMTKLFQLYDLIPDSWYLMFVFSNESLGKQSELVRWGLDWNLYVQNFEKYLSYNRVKTIGLCPTVSLFTMTGICDYLNWAFNTVRRYGKKIVITGNWVDETLLNPAYSNRKEVIQDLQLIVEKNKDLFQNENWYKECQTWILQLEKILGTKIYTESEFNHFLFNLSKQKNTNAVYNLIDFL